MHAQQRFGQLRNALGDLLLGLVPPFSPERRKLRLASAGSDVLLHQIDLRAGGVYDSTVGELQSKKLLLLTGCPLANRLALLHHVQTAVERDPVNNVDNMLTGFEIGP